MDVLREIIAYFGVEFDDKGIKKGEQAVAGFVDNLKSLAAAAGAAFAVHKIYDFIHGLTEEADALAKQARTMGMSLAAMQEWNYAASMQGVSAEALQMTLGRLSAGKYDAKGMKELGVAIKDTAGKAKGGEDLLSDVADKLAAIDDPAKRNALAMKVLGRSYKSLMPLLLDGSKGIQELREEFRLMGGGFSDEFAKDADDFGDNIDRLKAGWKNFSILLVSRVLPHLVKFTVWLVKTAPKVLTFVKNTRLLEIAVAALATKGVMMLSAKVGGLGKQLLGLGKVLGPLLILEDILTFFMGGDSYTGDLLLAIFPRETVEYIRNLVPDLVADWRTLPIFFEGLGNEILGSLSELAAGISDAFTSMWNAVTGGKSPVDAVKLVEQARATERQELMDKYDRIATVRRTREMSERATAASTAADKALAAAKKAAAEAPAGERAAAAIALKAAQAKAALLRKEALDAQMQAAAADAAKTQGDANEKTKVATEKRNAANASRGTRTEAFDAEIADKAEREAAAAQRLAAEANKKAAEVTSKITGEKAATAKAEARGAKGPATAKLEAMKAAKDSEAETNAAGKRVAQATDAAAKTRTGQEKAAAKLAEAEKAAAAIRDKPVTGAAAEKAKEAAVLVAEKKVDAAQLALDTAAAEAEASKAILEMQKETLKVSIEATETLKKAALLTSTEKADKNKAADAATEEHRIAGERVKQTTDVLGAAVATEKGTPALQAAANAKRTEESAKLAAEQRAEVDKRNAGHRKTSEELRADYERSKLGAPVPAAPGWGTWKDEKTALALAELAKGVAKSNELTMIAGPPLPPAPPQIIEKTTTVATVINVTVPPGTPETLANDVGKAIEKPSLRATQAALGGRK